jgi:hypothetical protein
MASFLIDDPERQDGSASADRCAKAKMGEASGFDEIVDLAPVAPVSE